MRAPILKCAQDPKLLHFERANETEKCAHETQTTF
jgi:hypothetical protein